MESDQDVPSEALERAARDRADGISRLRGAAVKLDSQPALLAAAKRLRMRLPGDERFGDPLSTAGARPVEVVARGVSSLRPGERESVLEELSMAGLQLWQSMSEATGRDGGEVSIAILFTDLVGFSKWALKAGDAATLELLREVGSEQQAAVLARGGRIVKWLGGVLMATFIDGDGAVRAALDAQDAMAEIGCEGYRPQLRAVSRSPA
jgi:adenylate cyclase